MPGWCVGLFFFGGGPLKREVFLNRELYFPQNSGITFMQHKVSYYPPLEKCWLWSICLLHAGLGQAGCRSFFSMQLCDRHKIALKRKRGQDKGYIRVGQLKRFLGIIKWV